MASGKPRLTYQPCNEVVFQQWRKGDGFLRKAAQVLVGGGVQPLANVRALDNLVVHEREKGALENITTSREEHANNDEGGHSTLAHATTRTYQRHKVATKVHNDGDGAIRLERRLQQRRVFAPVLVRATHRPHPGDGCLCSATTATTTSLRHGTDDDRLLLVATTPSGRGAPHPTLHDKGACHARASTR